jgi:predicted transcriptional regulator
VKKEQVKKYESEQLISRVFDDSLPHFIAAFLKDKKLTEKEANEITKIIEEATKEWRG